MLRLMHLEVKYGYRLGKSEEEAANSFGFAVFYWSGFRKPSPDIAGILRVPNQRYRKIIL